MHRSVDPGRSRLLRREGPMTPVPTVDLRSTDLRRLRDGNGGLPHTPVRRLCEPEPRRPRIQVLIFEAAGGAADLCGESLQRSPFEVRRLVAKNAQELATQAIAKPCDAIVCDIAVGGSLVMEAIALIRRHEPDLPFIVLLDPLDVNTAPDEDILTECILAGATDGIERTDLAALPLAVAFAAEQCVLTKQLRHIERELELSRLRYQAGSFTGGDVGRRTAGAFRG